MCSFVDTCAPRGLIKIPLIKERLGSRAAPHTRPYPLIIKKNLIREMLGLLELRPDGSDQHRCELSADLHIACTCPARTRGSIETGARRRVFVQRVAVRQAISSSLHLLRCVLIGRHRKRPCAFLAARALSKLPSAPISIPSSRFDALHRTTAK